MPANIGTKENLESEATWKNKLSLQSCVGNKVMQGFLSSINSADLHVFFGYENVIVPSVSNTGHFLRLIILGELRDNV